LRANRDHRDYLLDIDRYAEIGERMHALSREGLVNQSFQPTVSPSTSRPRTVSHQASLSVPWARASS